VTGPIPKPRSTVEPLSRAALNALVDPELTPYLARMSHFDITDLNAARAEVAAVAARTRRDDSGLLVEAEKVIRPDGSALDLRIYTPSMRTSESLPVVLFMHGGGFVIGSLDSHHDMAADAARGANAVVVSVDYRLAPEYPYPAGLEDCYTALCWVREQRSVRGLDPDRVIVAGVSAGAGIAAGLALLARDRGGPPVCAQCLAQPSLADEATTLSRQKYVDTPMWSETSNILSWKHYLRGNVGPTPPYAAPARATDLQGLPSAYIAVAELDALRDEAIIYAQRLLGAGVRVELQVFPGTFHGSQRILRATVSRRQHRDWNDALRRAASAL
jgi:acetyl esterase